MRCSPALRRKPSNFPRTSFSFIPVTRSRRSAWCSPAARSSCRRISGATATFSPAPGQTYAAAFACAPSSVSNVSVVTETPTAVLFLNVKRLLTVCPSACAHHSRIIRNLLSDLAGKNLLLNEKLTHIAQRTTRAKLMSYLSAEAQRRGAVEFDIPFSRQQLADFLAVERSGLSLELGKMKKEGLLDYHKEHFVLNI